MAAAAASSGGWFDSTVNRFTEWGKSDGFQTTKNILGQIQGLSASQGGYKMQLHSLKFGMQGLQLEEDTLIQGYQYNSVLEQENLAMGLTALRQEMSSLASMQVAQAAHNGTLNSRSSLMMVDQTLSSAEKTLLNMRQASMNRRRAAEMEMESSLKSISLRKQEAAFKLKAAKKQMKRARERQLLNMASTAAAMIPGYGTAISMGINMFSQAKYGGS